jgi:sugar phosphate isomerase/epimerase
MKLGLHSATYTGSFYSGKALDLDEVIRRAATFGFDAVEIVGRSPHGNPLELSADDRARIRRLAEKERIDLACVAAQTDFSHSDARVREWCQLYLRETIRLAKDLGSPIVRVFAAGFENQRTDSSRLQQWNWAREGLTQGARDAEKEGVLLALHNHAPLVHSYRRVLEMIDEVGSPALKACIDPHCVWWADESMEEAVQACGPLLVHSHLEDFKTFSPQLEFYNPRGWIKYTDWEFCPLGEGMVDHRAFASALRKIGYTGSLVYTICGPVHRGHELELAPLSHIDELVARAVRYMKELAPAAAP